MNEIQKAEFRGFFYADGSASLVRYKKKYQGKHYWLYRPQVTVGLRDDQLEYLKLLRSEFGGSIWQRNKDNSHGTVQKRYGHNTKPGFVWTVTNQERCLELCEILADTDSPFPKRRVIEILREYLLWKSQKHWNAKHTDEERARVQNWWEQCRALNSYQGHQVTD